MLAQEIIRKKRNNEELTTQELHEFIQGVTHGTVSDSQIAAMAMAICINKLTTQERISLTMEMAQSGTTINWANKSLDGPVLDKHSTGGVGDKVSLVLAPLIASCGGYVPMISGRGLGHTGGTLDKMDSIPGYVSVPELDSFIAVVKNAGCAICGQTHELAPADRRIYSVRDVTGTVESIDLITSSILSKKLAAGLDALIMDIKVGSGAFMGTEKDALELAQSIISVATGAGIKCSALITDMNQVLGHTAGNALEVIECIEFMRGENIDPRLYEVIMELSSELLVLGNLAKTTADATHMAKKHLADGSVMKVFEKMVKDLGGPGNLSESYKKSLEVAKLTHELPANETGIITKIDVRKVGLSIIELGGGRRDVKDAIDHSVGLSSVASIGELVGPKERPLAIIHSNDETKANAAQALLLDAFTIAPQSSAAEPGKVIKKRVTI